MKPATLINNFCRHAFHLALLLGIATIALAPFHLSGARNVDVIRLLPGNRIEIRPTSTNDVQVGDVLPVFRFNPGWKTPIGEVTLVEKTDRRWVATFNPETFKWPMGIQGSIVRASPDGRVVMNIGSEVGLAQGQLLSVFKDRVRFGQLVVTAVTAGQSTGRVTRWKTRSLEQAGLTGMIVNQYLVANQVAWFEDTRQDAIDATVYGTLICLWAWSLFSSRPGAIFAQGCARLRDLARRTPATGRLLASLLIGIPVVYVAGVVAWYGVTRTLGWVTESLQGVLPQMPVFPSWPHPGELPGIGSIFRQGSFLGDNHILPTTLVLGVMWIGWLATRRSSPALAAWKASAFRGHPQENPKRPRGVLVLPLYLIWEKLLLPWVGRVWLPKHTRYDPCAENSRAITLGAVNWSLHLIVFFAFGRALTDFLANNLNAIGNIGWATRQLNFTTPAGILEGLSTLLTEAPQLDSAHDWFTLLRLTLWTLTICGCLLGYGHTVLSIIWKPTAIRNIDMTPWGWLLNAICYGPLLGGIIHKLAPDAVGVDPYVIEGGYFWMTQVTELLLNLLYTLSIWNLGTMFGVMVDKGVRRSGFYSVVRHPSYTLEPLMFIVLELNAFATPAGWLAAAAYPIKYWLRSERDDLFMTQSNPEYTVYRQETRWKFIPGLY